MMAWIISSSLLIIIVILLRKVLKGKIRLRLQYTLWALVLVRLLLPFSIFESSFSIMNLTESVKPLEVMDSAAQLSDMEEIVFTPSEQYSPSGSVGNIDGYYSGDSDHSFPTHIESGATAEEFQQLEKAIAVRDILIPLWLCGAIIMAVYFLITNLRFAAILRRSRRETEIKDAILPVYISAAIPTPCLFGFFSPAVYLTPQCENDAATMEHVLAHELTHYRHGDNIWAILRCAALALHWYNPLVWWAAILSKRDGELACDEGAIGRLGESERASYGRTLISMTCRRSDFGAIAHTATTMTGSSKSIKERIILIAKKPKMAVCTLVAVVIIASVAVLCTFSGANRGFTDAEAKKMAKPLAESVAFVNSLELGNKPEIIRYEGEGAEADPDTKLKYVKLIYPTKNNTKEIVVEFCMTDGKGQHYDEPFSVVSRLSMNLSQVVPGTSSSVDYVQLWKKNYPNPEVPDEYKEELKEFVTHFWYGEEYTQATPDDTALNTEGFTVYLKDGSSLTIGLDYVELEGVCYHLISPELPEWLNDILTTPGQMEMEYDELIRVSDTVKAKVDPAIIELAVDDVRLDVNHYVRDMSMNIIDAELTALEHISTGAADQYGNSIEMYRLEYRLKPADIDSVVLSEGMKIEDDWITEWTISGQPYIMVYMQDGVYTGLSKTISTENLHQYDTDDIRDRYGDNIYLAAAMEFLYQVIGDYEYDWYVMLSSGGGGLPPYYHMRHESTWTENGWLSAIGTPLNYEAYEVPSFTIGDHPGFLVGYNELDISFNRFIGRGAMKILDENFEPLNLGDQVFYEAADLYALDPGSYYVTFDITVLGKYITEEREFETSVYTCVFRLNVTPNEKGVFYFPGDAESLVELYAREVYANEMLAVEGDYAITDYKLVDCELYAQSVDGSSVVGLMHYAISPVNPELPDWWAGNGMDEGEYEYQGMWIRHHYFTLESQGSDTWKCTGLSTGGAGGWGYFPCSLSDEEITEWLIQALKEDSDTIFLQILPVCNPQLIPRGYENSDIYLDFFNSIVDYAIGDDQLTRNLYIMKGAQLSDGAFAEQYSIALRMLYEYDFGSYAAALSFLDEEERENVDMLLEYAMSYYE